ncbi:MAG: serine/threonine protein kinase [Myxococcota bacterium]|nr:serine/threonine protein kinase [Myxococcota bacterium]
MVSVPPRPGSDVLGDFDDGDEGLTTVGMDLFGHQQVPDYPAIARLGQFEILGRMARGGMAEVYLARERAEDGSVRHVVVKRVLTEMQHDPEMLRMFVDEGRIALRLFHPNVCHVYECGDVAGLTFMALEWVHGTSLRDVIRRAAPRGGLPIPVVVHVIARIAGALEYVHNARGLDGKPLSIIHQDVSPHNVMLSWRGHVKLLDFGIAKTSAQAARGAGAPQGKYEYMAPEQVRGEPIDARADVFALGVCLYESLTSHALYARDSLPQIMTAVVEESVPSIRSVRPELPEALDRIVRKALAKRAADRYQSAGELEAALDGWLAANGQTVADIRVALAIGGLYSPAEKAPLPPNAADITGTLPALTALGMQPPEAWSERFDHSRSSRPPATSPEMASATPEKRGGLGLVVGGLTMLTIGALALVVAMWFALRT